MARAERSRSDRLLLLIAVFQGALALSFPTTSLGQEAAVIVNVDSGLIDSQGEGNIAFDLLRRIYQGERANLPGQGRKRYEPLYVPLQECVGFTEILNTLYPPDFDRHLFKAHVQHIPTRPREASFEKAIELVSKTELAFAIVDASAILESNGVKTTDQRSGRACQERGRLPENVKVLKIDGHPPGARDYPLRVTVKAKSRD